MKSGISIGFQKGKKNAKHNQRGQKGQKTNVKNSPFSLKDGDEIGVKV